MTIPNPLLDRETQVYDPVRQRKDAMRRANQTRIAISEFKRDLRTLTLPEGCSKVADFLRNPSEDVSAIRVHPLLVAIKRMGNAKAHNLLCDAGIQNSDKRVRDLTHRQRVALAHQLVSRWCP